MRISPRPASVEHLNIKEILETSADTARVLTKDARTQCACARIARERSRRAITASESLRYQRRTLMEST